jgi:photosystem II stability/assembly factor-like uncharacterized protein
MKIAALRSLLLVAILTAGAAAAVAVPTPQTIDAAAFAGLKLRTIGPAAMSGRIVDLAVVESDPYTFYVASATGGVWKTTNNGTTFAPVFEREATHSVGDIVVHQADPDIVWVGTGERANRQSSSWGDGVYKSTDGGASWTNMGLRDSHHVGRIVLHPTDPSIVYVAAMGHLWGPNDERGVYRSRDGGDSWERLLYVDADTGAVDIALDPDQPDVVYAATYQRRRTAFGFHGGGPGSGLYRSDDGGDNWDELTGAAVDADAEPNADHPEGTLINGLPAGEYGRIGISVHEDNPEIVYATIEQGLRYSASVSYEDERFGGVYRSEDRGRTWQHMSDWNPRPMYASQILVDPSDDQRIYQQNSFSYSDDGGVTWTVPRQSIHSDDRFLWVNPQDSRHVMKASDGALGISYDRGLTWRWASNLPVSQYYRVAVDMKEPYNVIGGLQDNGTWIGPSETYRSEGILNEDWRPIGGGDGFLGLPDPSDPDSVYVESQYLGLGRLDLSTGQRQSLRPGNPQGYRFVRRIWRLFGSGVEPELLEQEMEPANWDGPYILSPHDPATLYAGTQHLWVSRDRGGSWRDLGRMSNAWERSEVEIMGQAPTTRTASLDDGVPYFATVTVIAESPLREGLLFVGTDDGNVKISEDGGDSWREARARFPGLPARTWVADIEPSTHDDAVAFAAFAGYRENDFTNYLYRSEDGGRTWTSIVGDLPAERVIRAVQQDTVNPTLLYVATELGFFFSTDGGERWVELKNNMPTLAINDFVIHPRDNDLVLGTHGRGVWILDNIGALRELSSEVAASPAHLFSIDPARMTRRGRTTGSTGDTTFRGANPPNGAVIDYWLGAAVELAEGEGEGEAETEGEEQAERESEGDASPVSLTVHDSRGALVRTLRASGDRGINRVVWDLRHESLPIAATIPEDPDPARADRGERRRPRGGPAGPLVVPGTYTVRLSLGDTTSESEVEVREDRRINAPPSVRASWTALQHRIGKLYVEANDLAAQVVARETALREQGDEEEAAAARRFRASVEELRGRILGVGRNVSGWVGSPTADQRSEMAFYRDALAELRTSWETRLAAASWEIR